MVRTPPNSSDSSERAGPSLEDFAAFHSMVCHPLVARRCIQYFDGGALFASQDDYERHDLATFDYTRTPIQLSLFSYYMLVFFSATGFLTWMGRTNSDLVREEDVFIQVGTSQSEEMSSGFEDGKAPVVKSLSILHSSGQKALFIPSKVIAYIQSRSAIQQEVTEQTQNKSKVRLIRQFEFTFGSLLVVMMCHFECGGKKYLVEVYDFLHKGSTLTRLISSIMPLVRDLLLKVSSMIWMKSTKEEKQS